MRPQPSDLLAEYLDLQGESEVPLRFHQWSFWAGLSAVVSDRISLQKIPGESLCPNLYVFLIGHSAAGKGAAIDAILPTIKACRRTPIYEAEITAAAFVKALHKQKDHRDPIEPLDTLGARCLLVQEELSLCIGTGPLAFDFVKLMTGLFKYRPGEWRKDTISSKTFILRRILFTWLAGNTWEWMQKTIPFEDLRAGFGRRIIPIVAERDPTKRIALPEPVDAYDAHMEAVWQRFQWLSRLEGEFTFSELGLQTFDMWYRARPIPPKPLHPWHFAIDDLVLKMAMLAHLTRLRRLTDCTWLLSARDIRDGIRWAADGYRDVSRMLRMCTSTVDPAARVYDVIETLGTAPRSRVMTESYVNFTELTRAVDTLLGRHWITQRIEKLNGVPEPVYTAAGREADWQRWGEIAPGAVPDDVPVERPDDVIQYGEDAPE